MERWGISPEDFDAAINVHTTDDALYQWLLMRTTKERLRAANEWLLKEKSANLDRQDSEEGATI